jgi:hypothetical protein
MDFPEVEDRSAPYPGMEIPAPDKPGEYGDHRFPHHDEMAFLIDKQI